MRAFTGVAPNGVDAPRGHRLVRNGADERPRDGVRTVGILGIGHHVPDGVLTNADLTRLVETSDEWIVTRTGMRERRIASDSEATSDMAIAAARAALASAAVEVDEVDLILVATATPDHQASPSTAAIVQHGIGASRAAGFDLGAACAGFVHALVTGEQFIRTGACRRVLVIGADKLSAITDYEDRNSCILFGDGAGAVVLGPDDGRTLLAHDLGQDGSGADLICMPAGGSRRPASSATVAARAHYLTLDGREVFRFAVQTICQQVEELARRASVSIDAIDWLVPHQANLRIIEAAARKLGRGMDRVVTNVASVGNTSSASIPIALSEAVAAGRFRDGQLMALVAFGGGLTWGSMLVRW